MANNNNKTNHKLIKNLNNLIFITTVIILVNNINYVQSLSYFELESKLFPCSFFDSINITSGVKFGNGSILHDGVLYPKQYYSYYDYVYPTHLTKERVPRYIRGCVCFFRTCVRLCCPNSREYYHQSERSCKKDDGEYIIQIQRDEGITEHNLYGNDKTDLAIVHGKPCDGYFLQPEQYDYDGWSLLPNGEIYFNDTDSNYDISKYCLSNVYNINRTNDDVAVLRAHICFGEEKTPLSPFGMLLSVPFLLATFLVYALLKELRASLHGKSLMCYVIGLTVGYTLLSTLLLSGQTRPSEFICYSLAYVTYFSFMASFFWLNVISFDIWWTFGRGGDSDKKRFLKYSAYAWGCSLTILLICYLMQNLDVVPESYRPGIGRQSCWLYKDTTAEFFYLYLPVITIITMNIIFFAMTAHKIRLAQKATSKALSRGDSRKHSKFESEKDKFSLYFRLFIIMGVTWSMEVISWAIDPQNWIFYLTDAMNCIQGILIFILFVWKPRVRALLAKRYRSYRGLPPKSRASASTTTHMSMSQTERPEKSQMIRDEGTTE